MSYLDLIEEFPKNPPYTQFEKILIAARRAKDLHDEDRAPLAHDHLTAPYIALQELRDELILPSYQEDPPADLVEDESEDGDEEE